MKLYETITAENWTKGVMHGPDGGCLHGHLADVYGVDGWLDAGCRILSAIRVLFPDRVTSGLIRFNDHPDTTIDDVLRVLKVADV